MIDVNQTPMPEITASGMNFNGGTVQDFQIDNQISYPDVRSFRCKFGLLIPATNTSMEHELWSIIFKNQAAGLEGVGIHTSNILTPVPKLATSADLVEYRRQFLIGLKAAVDAAELAQPQHLIMGMSLEHIIYGLDKIRAAMAETKTYTDLSWSTWQDAAPLALEQFKAKRIGLISPFDAEGNKNAVKLFTDLGYDVVANFGFSCAHAMHIAHIPDWAKEKVIIEYLAKPKNKLDAIVQCGTNMSLQQVTEKLEPIIGIPVLGINAILFWHALRARGFNQPLIGGGRLLREF